MHVSKQLEILSRLQQKKICLISCLSFEERSLAGPELLAGKGLGLWICLRSVDIETDISDKVERAQILARNNASRLTFFPVERKNPLTLADQAVSALDMAFSSPFDVVLDITTMTHEMLLVILAALQERPKAARDVNVIYNCAQDYAVSADRSAHKWISRGIQTVRSVIGYPGLSSPGRQTTLLALPGYDLERVRRIAEDLEPEKLIVGIGRAGTAEHQWLHDRNIAVARHLIGGTRGDVFEYNALDPLETATAVDAALRDCSGNVVLCPLNSKPSTFGVGLVALQHTDWQVCYAPALVYNINYSTPSENFVSFSYHELLDGIKSIGGAPSVGDDVVSSLAIA